MSKRSHRRKRHNVNVSAIDKVMLSAEQPNGVRSLSKEISIRERSIDFIGVVLGGLPNPDPVLEKMGDRIEVYEDLMFDGRVTSASTLRKSAVKSMEWDIIGEYTPEEEVELYRDLFSGNLNGIKYNMRNIISEILDAVFFGFKPLEIIWGETDGKILPVKFVGKPCRWFQYDDNNTLRFLSNKNMINGELLPENRFIVAHNDATYDNPYGKAILSSCFWPVTFRKNGFKFWTIFVEKYGIPYILGKAPSGTKTEEIEETKDMLEAMVQDAVAVVREEYEVSLIEASGKSSDKGGVQDTYINACNREIDMSIMGNNLVSEVQGGSFAATKSHMQVRDDIVEGDAILVENTFNELISITHTMNFNTESPKLKLYPEEKVDTTRAERDLKIQQGDSRMKFTKEYYQRVYNFQETDFEIVEQAPVDTLEKEGEYGE